MKIFNFLSKVILGFIFGSLIFDGIMVYCHFFNNNLGNMILTNIDSIIY